MSSASASLINSMPPSCEAIEAECNNLGMELLNVLEYIGDTIDYRQITLLVQKLSNSMDFIANGVSRLKNISSCQGELEGEVEEKRAELEKLQSKLKAFSQ